MRDMKILAIGDFHGKFPANLQRIARNCDMILCTGDFGGSKKLLNVVFKYFYEGWWKKVGKKRTRELVLEDYVSGKRIIKKLSKLNVPVYTIHGNWDFEDRKQKERTGGLMLEKYSEFMKKLKNIHFLNKRIINLDGLKIYAFGGEVAYSAYLNYSGFSMARREKHRRRHRKQRRQLFSKGEKGIDIILTHIPSYGYFDVVRYEEYNPMNGKHIGFKPYSEFIRKYQPRLFICGHIHEYQGIRRLGKTIIVSTGAAQNGKAAVIDYSSNSIKIKLVK